MPDRCTCLWLKICIVQTVLRELNSLSVFLKDSKKFGDSQSGETSLLQRDVRVSIKLDITYQ